MNKRTFRLFLLTRVPLAWLAGLRLHHLDGQRCAVSVRHRWLNQNPFKSMFWAVQAMAAELSTGTLCFERVRRIQPRPSMLLVHMEAGFTRKALGTVLFTCDQGEEIEAVLARALATREGQVITLRSVGTDEKGEGVAEMRFTWSFKVRAG